MFVNNNATKTDRFPQRTPSRESESEVDFLRYFGYITAKGTYIVCKLKLYGPPENCAPPSSRALKTIRKTCLIYTEETHRITDLCARTEANSATAVDGYGGAYIDARVQDHYLCIYIREEIA